MCAENIVYWQLTHLHSDFVFSSYFLPNGVFFSHYFCVRPRYVNRCWMNDSTSDSDNHILPRRRQSATMSESILGADGMLGTDSAAKS